MQALVFHGLGQKSLVERPKPTVALPTDAVVRITKTSICGSDLHILKGDVTSCQPGTILGHEGVGVVDSVGTAVSCFQPGDRVLISCITSCGRCAPCRQGMYSHCRDGGWLLGNRIDGTQAEYVRIPHADGSLYLLPANADEEALVMLSDVLPTGFECGVQNGKVNIGSSLAIVGAGPVGVAALLTAQLYALPEIIIIDIDENRLAMSKHFGATITIDSSQSDAAAQVMARTDGRGVDTVIEAVGLPATFALCQDIVAPGGTIANVGVHGCKVDLHLERLWSHNVTITTGLVDTISIPLLLKSVQAKRLDAKQLITHRFKLGQILEAYDTFARAADSKALKVIIEN